MLILGRYRFQSFVLVPEDVEQTTIIKVLSFMQHGNQTSVSIGITAPDSIKIIRTELALDNDRLDPKIKETILKAY